jgi:hypothetical protein
VASSLIDDDGQVPEGVRLLAWTHWFVMDHELVIFGQHLYLVYSLILFSSYALSYTTGVKGIFTFLYTTLSRQLGRAV